jgi:hypothetical protein
LLPKNIGLLGTFLQVGVLHRLQPRQVEQPLLQGL